RSPPVRYELPRKVKNCMSAAGIGGGGPNECPRATWAPRQAFHNAGESSAAPKPIVIALDPLSFGAPARATTPTTTRNAPTRASLPLKRPLLHIGRSIPYPPPCCRG